MSYSDLGFWPVFFHVHIWGLYSDAEGGADGCSIRWEDPHCSNKTAGSNKLSRPGIHYPRVLTPNRSKLTPSQLNPGRSPSQAAISHYRHRQSKTFTSHSLPPRRPPSKENRTENPPVPLQKKDHRGSPFSPFPYTSQVSIAAITNPHNPPQCTAQASKRKHVVFLSGLNAYTVRYHGLHMYNSCRPLPFSQRTGPEHPST